jgi:hypothetical protein
MILEKEGNRIYIEKNRKNIFTTWFFTIISIVIMILLCIIIFTYNANKEKYIGTFYFKIDFGLLNSLLQNNFGKTVLAICVISSIVIFIVNNLFYGDCDYYIDIVTRKIHYSNGKWKLKKEIILEFENIKNIVLIENMITGDEGGKSYSYQIDIYDNELNAYKVYIFSDYDAANNIANKIGVIIGVEVIDWTHVENYEGFKTRIL